MVQSIKNVLALLPIAVLASHGSAIGADTLVPDARAAVGCTAAPETEDRLRGFVEWARQEAIPLYNLEQSESADLSPLRSVIGRSTVVAIGEPAHGAHEPLAFRNRLFRFLAEQLGCTAIALETGFSGSRRVQDFVTGGPGDAEQVAVDSFTWGFGAYEENVELIRWMRAYNADPSHDRKLSFYGIDLSGGQMGGMLRARIALDDALAFLTRAAPETSRSVRDELEPYLDRFTAAGFAALTAKEQAELAAAIDRLIAILERERRTFIEDTSEDDYEWASRNAEVARQLEQMFRAWPPSSPAEEGLSPEFYRPANVRDAAMADNVRWVLEREGAGGRVLVFAHNAHIMNAPLRGGLWSVYEEPPMTMGQHLRAALSEQLLIIGVSSAANGPGLPAAATSPGSLDLALDRIDGPAFLLDLGGARECAGAAGWLAQRRTMRANFTSEIELEPGAAFDALVFFQRLTPAGGEGPAGP